MSALVAEGMNHDREDDGALAVHTLAGDGAAFGAPVDRYEEPVAPRSPAALRDVHDADDAARDTLLTALMKLDPCDQRPFRPRLLRIATNIAIDRRRHRAPRRTELLKAEASTNRWRTTVPGRPRA
jgi:DNA-directed RNA polymerase specialized sigma24 family protein